MNWPLSKASSFHGIVERRLDRGGAVERARLVAVGADRGDLAVVEMDDAGGVAHERRRIGGEEHLAVADAQHERAAVAGHDQRVGPLGIDDGQAIGADDAPQHRAHDGLERRAVVHQGDQMGEHLGVGVGGEDSSRASASCARSAAAFSMMPLCTTA